MKPSRRLSILMFMQLFAFGAFNPLLSLYMTRYLHFSGSQTGFVLAIAVISSLVAPLISVYVVDRRMNAKRLLILCQVVVAASTLGMGMVRDFWPFAGFYLLYTLVASPSIGIINAITFDALQKSPGGTNEYGSIRVWGTVGWMVSAWVISGLWMLLPHWGLAPDAQSLYPLMFLVAAFGAVMTLVITLGIDYPRKPSMDRKAELFPRETMAILLRPEILVLGIVYLLSGILDRFYTFGMGPFLVQQGFGADSVSTVLTLGQVSETLMLFLLASLLRRFSFKTLMVAGALIQAARFLLFALDLPWLSILGLSFHGIIFALVYSLIIMYLDNQTAPDQRQSLHQLILLFFTGGSTLVGNILAGLLSDTFGQAGALDFARFWWWPLGGALLTAALLAIGFRPLRGVAPPPGKPEYLPEEPKA